MVEEEMSEKWEERVYCPFRQGDCFKRKCMLFVTTKNGVGLGCSYNVLARKLDQIEFLMRPKKEQEEGY